MAETFGNDSDAEREADDTAPPVPPMLPPQQASWRIWLICGLLPLASAINYMDRQTLASASTRIISELDLVKEQYGDIEAVFGYGFVLGSLIFGIVADRYSIRWVYPFVLVSWSLVTVATGLATSYSEFLWLRLALGVFEAGHWPCGVRVIRGLIRSRGRTMGNGLLQCGTSVGAVATPLIMLIFLTDRMDAMRQILAWNAATGAMQNGAGAATGLSAVAGAFVIPWEVGAWRPAFQTVGLVGIAWAGLWLAVVRRSDFPSGGASVGAPVGASTAVPNESSWRVLLQKRMLIVFVVVALINTAWQLFRAWLHLFMQDGRGYTEQQALLFNSAWFGATEVGCLGVGVLVLWLTRAGLTVHSSRLIAFAACSAMCLTLLGLPWLPAGWLLLAVLLISGAGALGVFPLYHAFTQDISGRHQGKVTGFAGVAAWFLVPPAQKLFGRLVDESGSYDHGLVAAGVLPAVATFILWQFWGEEGVDDDESAGD